MFNKLVFIVLLFLCYTSPLGAAQWGKFLDDVGKVVDKKLGTSGLFHDFSDPYFPSDKKLLKKELVYSSNKLTEEQFEAIWSKSRKVKSTMSDFKKIDDYVDYKCKEISNHPLSKKYINKLKSVEKITQKINSKKVFVSSDFESESWLMYDDNDNKLFKNIFNELKLEYEFLGVYYQYLMNECANNFSNSDSILLFSSGGRAIENTKKIRYNFENYPLLPNTSLNSNGINNEFYIPVLPLALLMGKEKLVLEISDDIFARVDNKVKLAEVSLEAKIAEEKETANRIAKEREQKQEIKRRAYVKENGIATTSEIREFKNDFIMLCISGGKVSPSACRCVADSVSEKKYPNSVLQSIARGAPTKAPFEDVSSSVISLIFSCSF